MAHDYFRLAQEAIEFYWLSIYRGETLHVKGVPKRATFARYLREVRKMNREDEFMSALAMHGIELDRDVMFPPSGRLNMSEVYRCIYFSAINLQRLANYGGWGRDGVQANLD